jgi:hypothetical protein
MHFSVLDLFNISDTMMPNFCQYFTSNDAHFVPLLTHDDAHCSTSNLYQGISKTIMDAEIVECVG